MNCRGCGGDVYGHSVCPGCGATVHMTVRGPQLPDEPWKLTAPESCVLRHGIRGKDSRALDVFKLALMDLVARRALTLQGAWIRRRWAPGTRPMFLLGDGPRKSSVDEQALAPLIDLHSSMLKRRPSFGVPFDNPARGEQPGIPLDKFVTAAARRGYSAYVKRVVGGALRSRKLLTPANRRTPEGERAWQHLDAWLEAGDDPLRNWMHDQTWLRAYLAGAGTAVLLTEIAKPGHPVLQDIGRALAANPPTDKRFAASDGWDMSGLDIAAVAGSLDGIADGAFGALDAAFVGGGGGDGGGGGGG